MATLTPTLTLVSTDAFSDELNFSVTDSLTVEALSQGLTKQTITTSDDQELVDNAESGVFYFFAKNHDSTNFVILQTTASQQYARLSPGEFCFFAEAVGEGVIIVADTADCVVEYGVFTKG